MILEGTKKIILTLLFAFVVVVAQAATIKGIVLDKETKEPLIGATVLVKGTAQGAATDLDGAFEFKYNEKSCVLVISYVSYITQEITIEVDRKMADLLIEMTADQQEISSVSVVARVNLETEQSLNAARKASNIAIENMGAKEMSLKGLSNVQEGVKKLTGISVASAGQLIVRGLGDRYSITTLNGQPIASPNPDNKLIPLDIFPSSTVKNITVSKVYSASSYADYSGAHIDISTKELTGANFFSFGIGTGGYINTLGRDFYRMDKVSLFSKPQITSSALTCSSSEFTEMSTQSDVFGGRGFSVDKTTALPSINANAAWGHNYELGMQKLSILASAGISTEQKTMLDCQSAFMSTTIATEQYQYDSYETSQKISTLLNVGLTMRDEDRISYTMFFARNASNEYMFREGVDYERNSIIGSNDVTHIYKLMTNQLHGQHLLTSVLRARWDIAYTTTLAEEPDRRQVMFVESETTPGLYSLLNNDLGNTARYYGSLGENEVNAQVAFEYDFMDSHKLEMGAAYKDKTRDYSSVTFLYNRNNLNFSGTADDVYSMDDYFTFENVQSGLLPLERQRKDKDQYDAASSIYSAYVAADLSYNDNLNVYLGLRFESSSQTINYFSYKADSRTLAANDLFPAVNVKYSLNDENQLRFSVSRTITRPSFVEMAPFEYRESYGTAFVKGNEELVNSYNYNVDLRYELFAEGGDMFSVTGYFKYLDKPIERMQGDKSDLEIHTFQNADCGIAGGIEVELQKQLAKNFKMGLNGSYMYTNVELTDGVGTYTNRERQLQGASPFLFNADFTYTPYFSDSKRMSLALLYNFQDARIHSVGTETRCDIMQRAVHMLNFVAAYQFNEGVELKAQLTNLMNRPLVFDQELPELGKTVVVEQYNEGVGIELGVSFKF